ncbi:MAG TPA: TM2 domain-containing protein [Chthoniobacteraceae bacterium]|jgi:hypothetical protein|nr:TM2 domain-containing protein [Chthoniobacteraceae bacterium]
MSKKRILPALFLAGSVGFLGLHRFYAGRYITGLVQLVCFVAGFILLKNDLAGIQAAVQNLNLEDLQDWILQHPVHPLPVILVGISSFWALGDCVMLAARKFRDGHGEVMTRWM